MNQAPDPADRGAYETLLEVPAHQLKKKGCAAQSNYAEKTIRELVGAR